jgi:hypothetical protein
VQLPPEDLKPLYDFAVNCRECQAQLAAAQSNLDEQTKTRALSRERDAALQAAHGGSVLRRVVRAAKWFVIGAAAGAVAVRLAHPPRQPGKHLARTPDIHRKDGRRERKGLIMRPITDIMLTRKRGLFRLASHPFTKVSPVQTPAPISLELSFLP